MNDAAPTTPAKAAGAISAQQLAALLMLTPRRLQQLAAQGIVQRGEADRDEYILTDSVQGYIRFLRDRSDAPEGEGGDGLRELKSRLIKAQTEKLEQQIAQESGELVSAKEVEDGWAAQIMAWRTVLQNAVPDLALALAAVTDVDARLKVLQQHFDRLLDALIRAEPEALADETADEDAHPLEPAA